MIFLHASVVLKIKELHRICYDYFLREHEKKPFYQIFFLIADFVALKLNYVLMYCGIRIYFLNMWLKEFSLSL